jgi:nucleotide-binding universal stress UspA family protein
MSWRAGAKYVWWNKIWTVRVMKTILVPVDFSDVTLKVIKVAVHLAKPFQSKIILMHVSQLRPSLMGIGAGPDAVPVPQTSEPIAAPDYTERFAHLKEMVASIGLVSTIVEVEGVPTDLILAQAENSRVDLIVLGSHSRSPLSHLFLGSVADGVLPRARCPVLIVPLTDA